MYLSLLWLCLHESFCIPKSIEHKDWKTSKTNTEQQLVQSFTLIC